MRTLICDDDPRLRSLYRQEFEWAGSEVLEATDGDRCLEVAERDRPDLIVLDLAMPRRGGLSALAALSERCPDTPVIVVSSYASADIADRTRILGARACFTKPGFLARIPEVALRFGRSLDGDEPLSQPADDPY